MRDQETVQPKRRFVLAAVLLIIAAALTLAGGYLASLGGSPYYVCAGLLVLAAAVAEIRGDRRGRWAYGAMLLLTCLWAPFDGGVDPWSLQSRIFAPLVLSIWVYWRDFRALGRRVWLTVGGVCVVAVAIALLTGGPDAPSAWPRAPGQPGDGQWTVYGGNQAGQRFSPLQQINASNVAELKPIWTFHTGVTKGIGFETTPLMVGDRLYFCSEDNRIFAADPETGRKIWEFDPKTDVPGNSTCRGVAYAQVASDDPDCRDRIIFATADGRLMTLGARTGRLCRSFGTSGTVDLLAGLGKVMRAYYYVSSAPLIARGKIIVGGWIMDGQYVGEPSGVVRAFDLATGKFAWAWDIDRPDFHGFPAEGQTFSKGTPNSWGPMSFDEKLGLVYLPTGNATPDYWGAHRSPGSEKYASSVVALDVETGAARWSFQTVHHDLWDYDVSAQPTLVDLPVSGGVVPALLQATKRGQLFMLDRRTGRPIADVVERAVPQHPAAGDWNAPTQPFSVGMPAFDNAPITEGSLWGMTPLDQLWCRIKFKEARYDGPMTPPGTDHTISYPSYIGGVNWGGVSVDPVNRLMIVNWTRLANYTHLIPRRDADKMGVHASKDGGVHVGQAVPQMGTPFALDTAPFVSPLGVPCTHPPFGQIAAVSLDTRRIVWEHPLGTSRDSGPFKMPSLAPLPMGVPNTGGSLITAGGVVFIGATAERTFRALDRTNGHILWSSRIPAGGNASPMTYIGPRSGRQFVLIAAGGNASFQSGRSDALVAYALK